MKTKAGELAELRVRLAEAEEALRAIRSGEVDAVVVAGKKGPQVFTLEGAEHEYRVLIESMNEGALRVTADKTILYANQCFARMVKCPLEQVTGGSFRRFLSAGDRATLRPLLKRAAKSGSKIQVLLHAGDGSKRPVQISIRPLAKNGSHQATFGMVVTDMTEARRNEEVLRALSHRLVQAQESERGSVAFELHEDISQLTYAILFRCETLATELPARERAARAELMKLRDLLNTATAKIRRLASDLRPGALDELGLIPVLRDACERFGESAHASLDLDGVGTIDRLPPEVETALYRILQEVLKNVEKHARARHVAVCLSRQGDFVVMTVKDDGIGFDPDHSPAKRTEKRDFGLLGIQERATYVGGTLKVTSARRAGTEIEVRIPLPPCAARANGADL